MASAKVEARIKQLSLEGVQVAEQGKYRCLILNSTLAEECKHQRSGGVCNLRVASAYRPWKLENGHCAKFQRRYTFKRRPWED